MPTTPTPGRLAKGRDEVRRAATDAGRNPDDIEIATILTILLDEDQATAQRGLTDYLQAYYRTNAPLSDIAQIVGVFAGTASSCAERLREFHDAGASTIIIRLAVDDQAATLHDHGPELLANLHRHSHPGSVDAGNPGRGM